MKTPSAMVEKYWSNRTGIFPTHLLRDSMCRAESPEATAARWKFPRRCSTVFDLKLSAWPARAGAAAVYRWTRSISSSAIPAAAASAPGRAGGAGGPRTLLLNVNSAFIGFSQITLEATRDISLANFTTWNLNDSTGISDAGSLLTLRAGRNIVLGNSSHIAAGAGWSVKMFAGDLTRS